MRYQGNALIYHKTGVRLLAQKKLKTSQLAFVMKATAVIHIFSPRNFKTESYTRNLNEGGLVAVSRHLVFLGGAGHI